MPFHPERHVIGWFGLMAAGHPRKNPLARYCWAPVEVSNLRPGVPSGAAPYMREVVIIAAACFLIGIMAAALIVHFVVP
jgi:hypothetical protein